MPEIQAQDLQRMYNTQLNLFQTRKKVSTVNDLKWKSTDELERFKKMPEIGFATHAQLTLRLIIIKGQGIKPVFQDWPRFSSLRDIHSQSLSTQ